MTAGAVLAAADLYDQIADWEGAPPAYLSTYPLSDCTEVVLEFLDLGHNAPTLTAGVWVSVDLRELQRIAVRDAAAFRDTTGESPW